MKSFVRKSLPLEFPKECDAKRKLFIESQEPLAFTIQYYDKQALTVFDNSPFEFIPLLPWGYHWEKKKKQYGVYKLNYINPCSIELILYGPDEKNQINYNLVVDGHNFYTLSHTRNGEQARLKSKDRKYPKPINTNASGYYTKTTPYMPGHCVDHVDSIIPPAEILARYGKNCISSYHHSNYIPEVQKDYWGLTMRRGLVAAQRKAGLSYAQLAEYGDNYQKTISGAAIPESVYFYCLNAHYKPNMVSWIDWDKDYNQHKKNSKVTVVKHMESFSTSVEAAPKALIWDVNASDEKWTKAVRDTRYLGHNIRKNKVKSYNSARDQIYAYSNSSVLEYQNSYSSISAALAASELSQVKLTKAMLTKAVNQGLKLIELDEPLKPINKNRYKWVKHFHNTEKPGFDDEEVLDAIKQLTFG